MVDLSWARTVLFFYKNRRVDLVKKHFLGENLLWNFISAINKWPIVSSWKMLSRIWLNSRRVRVFIFLIQPEGRAWSWPDYIGYIRPSLRFLLLSFFFSFTLFFNFKSNINLFLSTLSFGKTICESKTRHVFKQLRPPIKVLSNTLTCSASVGRAIKHLLLSLWTQPLKELAELHFLRLNLKSFCSCEARLSNILHKIMVT